MLHSLRFLFSSKCHLFHNATFFGTCIIHILYTECAKIKKKSGAKRLRWEPWDHQPVIESASDCDASGKHYRGDIQLGPSYWLMVSSYYVRGLRVPGIQHCILEWTVADLSKATFFFQKLGIDYPLTHPFTQEDQSEMARMCVYGGGACVRKYSGVSVSVTDNICGGRNS